MRHVLALVAVMLVAAACGTPGPKVRPAHFASPPPSGGLPWVAPPDAIRLTRLAGLEPETHETLVFHVHAHLDVFVNGQSVTVPAGIGINIHDPAVHTGPGPSYGGISPPCKQVCISPLHTHSPDGVLHTEAKTAVPNKLGEFFVEWHVKLNRDCIGGYCRPQSSIQIFVNGKAFGGDPRQIALTDKKEIAIVIGTPPKTIPTAFPV